MAITLKDAVDGFRKQWNWMADETLRQKRKVEKDEYFDAHGIDVRDRPFNECYMCEFAPECVACPICWGGTLDLCNYREPYYRFDGLFGMWNGTRDYQEAARLARKIANLPLKEKYRKEYENAID